MNQPNPVGVYQQGSTTDRLYELAGNVYEWTRSLYRPYDPADGREQVDGEGPRVVRDGSWYMDKDRVRCACRNGNYPWTRIDNFGFRLARASL